MSTLKDWHGNKYCYLLWNGVALRKLSTGRGGHIRRDAQQQFTQGQRSVKKEEEQRFTAQYLEARDFSRVVVHSQDVGVFLIMAHDSAQNSEDGRPECSMM